MLGGPPRGRIKRPKRKTGEGGALGWRTKKKVPPSSGKPGTKGVFEKSDNGGAGGRERRGHLGACHEGHG